MENLDSGSNVQIPVSTLEGALLDYWVAKAEGFKDADIIDHIPLMDEAPPSWCRLPNGDRFEPSRIWATGGPIIEREKIKVSDTDGHPTGDWYAEIPIHVWTSYPPDRPDDPAPMYGRTFLEAAMRCYVASKFGESVPKE